MASTKDIRKAFLNIKEVSGVGEAYDEDPVYFTDVSQMFYLVEDHHWTDSVPQVQDFYAKVAEFIDEVTLEPPVDDILKFIRDHDLPKMIILCIILRKRNRVSEDLYNALFKISSGSEEIPKWNPLQTMTLTYNMTPQEVEDGLPIVNADFCEGSETLDLEYSIEHLMDPAYAKGMRSWTSGISESIVDRFKNIDIQAFGDCAEKSAEIPKSAFNLKINRSCRKVENTGIITNPKKRIQVVNDLIESELASKFYDGSFFQFMKRRHDNNIIVGNTPKSYINFDTVDIRSVLINLWTNMLNEQLPLNDREFVTKVLNKKDIINAVKSSFEVLINSYGIDDIIEKNTSVIAITLGFTDILCFEMSSKLYTYAKPNVFFMTPPDRIKTLIRILMQAMNDVISQINEGNVNKPLYIPEKIIRFKMKKSE
jgi:hypothetical protein